MKLSEITGQSPGASDAQKPKRLSEITSAPTSTESHSQLDNLTKPLADLPKDIWADVKAGFRAETEAVHEAQHPSNPLDMTAGLKAIGGAAQIAGAPITGAAKALVGDPSRAVIPQDTIYGKMASNALEDAAAVFGPAAASKLGVTLSKAASTVGSPIKTLMDNGVQLTLGQLEPRFAKRIEEAAKSVPILGSFIRSSEARTLDSFNVATVNKALEPLGIKVDGAKNGREAIQQGQKAIGKAYDDVLKQIPAVHYDTELDAELDKIKTAASELPPGHQDRLTAIIDHRISQRVGPLMAFDGRTFKDIESQLTNLAAESKASADGAERSLGYAIDDVRGALRDALGRQYATLKPQLEDINHAFSRFADVERAASSRATGESRFTAGDLLASIKRSDKSPRDKQFAAGNRPLQDWGETAHKIIGNKLPDSGTTERAMIDMGALGMGSGAAIYGHPGALMGLGAALTPYTKTGQSAINAGLPEIPAAIRGVGALGRSPETAAAAEIAKSIQGLNP